MKNFLSRKKINILGSAAAIAAMWLVWVVAYFAEGNDFVVPSFWDTLKSFGALLASAQFWSAIGYTMLATLEAFLISCAMAAVCAAAGALSRFAAAFIGAVVGFLRALPTLAVILILLVWTTPRVAPMIVTVLVLFPIVYAQLSSAIGGVDGGLAEVCKVYKISRRDRLFKVYLPLALPPVLEQSGADFSLALKIMISAEVLASTRSSYGVMMQNARLYLDMPTLAALTLAAVVIGAVVNVALSQLARPTYKWTKRRDGNDD